MTDAPVTDNGHAEVHETSDRRLRLVRAVMQIDLVYDDGTTLSPLPPVQATLDEMGLRALDVDALLAEAAQQLG